jgi:hypothetical protein
VDPQRCEVEREVVDEVARQRRKRQAAALDRSVPGFPAVTVGQLAEESTAAATAGGADAVSELLATGGHTAATIDQVLRCLDLRSAVPVPTPGGAVCTQLQESSAALRRLRTVAELEAMLLKD